MTIMVTDVVRSEALKQALGALSIPVGGRLFHHDLAQAWRDETGLRQEDLQQSLSEIAERGGINFSEREQGTLIELTNSIGHALEPTLNPIRRLQAGWVLRKTRRRQREIEARTSAGMLMRREADQAAVRH